MLTPMDTPRTRAEFERRFYILREQVMNGKLMFPRGMRMSELGLLEVRELPNGRLDFLSVNEFARLQANMTVQMEGMYADNDQASEARGASGGSQFVSGTESEAPSKKRPKSSRNSKPPNKPNLTKKTKPTKSAKKTKVVETRATKKAHTDAQRATSVKNGTKPRKS